MALSKKGKEARERFLKGDLGRLHHIGARGIIEGAGQTADVLALPYNLLAENKLPSAADKLGEVYDKYTDKKGIPTSDRGKLLKAAANYIGPGAAIAKIPTIAKSTSRLGKTAHAFLSPTKLGTAGAIASQEVLNRDPDNIIGAIAAGMAPQSLISYGKNVAKNKSLTPEFVRTLSKFGTKIKDSSYLKGIKKNPNIYEGVIEELGARQGSGVINKATHDVGGQEFVKGAELQKKVQKEAEKEQFGILRNYIEKVTDNFTNANNKVDVTKTVNHQLDKYKKLTDFDQQKAFLNSVEGKNMMTLMGIKHQQTAAHSVKQLSKKLAKEPKEYTTDYITAKTSMDNLFNETSKHSDVIGTHAQKQIRDMRTSLRDDISSIYKGDKDMYDLWDKATSQKSVYHDKYVPIINDVLEHAPRKGYEGDYNKAFLAATKDVEKSPEKLNFLTQHLDETSKEVASQSIFRDIGKEKNKYNALSAKNKLGELEENVQEAVKGGLSPSTRQTMEAQNPLLDALEYERSQPYKNHWWNKKVYGVPLDKVMPSPYMNTDKKTIDRSIDALENQLQRRTAVKEPTYLGTKPKNIANTLFEAGAEHKQAVSGLTPEEQAEVDALENEKSIFLQTQSILPEQPVAQGLTPEERLELEALENEKASLMG